MVLMTSGKKKLWINKISKLKNGDTNVIVQSVEKQRKYWLLGYNFYKQNKDKLKEVKIKGDDGKSVEPIKRLSKMVLIL